jgi:hypothetical protein
MVLVVVVVVEVGVSVNVVIVGPDPTVIVMPGPESPPLKLAPKVPKNPRIPSPATALPPDPRDAFLPNLNSCRLPNDQLLCRKMGREA